ncbi:tRNA (adenosine(37)-N6)-threonylcarbamoyltransferase complex transferase subunit TsaD [Rubellimicrobium aerolatum]|uniref:tRNA N6-adenosine threonylcarbamoyltransferase n=1 Tax=Rubellimicrobium aerolatum TaxID=490979 RepID=A0ABW0SA67_9RHOB|nr:tRNA (adenosine(37)-N6)-threonylcarbamoyltransferase complex transferase subunit TsaD [Rubellimicrobium aerolatum]MBP1805117.1 N6-L-threonylcarbamoyladenine synthase [Rubellimicrobium aerolatum]
MDRPLTFLGIESSCDDSAAAILRDGPAAGRVLASVVRGQGALHAAFGGVVPEIAARAHAEVLDHCVEAALARAGVGLGDLDGIAVTAGPGLIGGVLAGVMTAKGLAAATGLPLWGVNHLAGHALTPRLTDDLAFPYLLLLVSGGHCQFLVVEGPDRFRRLGGTIDDAPGEAFDKVARILGLPQPGGPEVEREAATGNPRRIPLPRPLLDREGCDLSFSGLKTAVLRARDSLMSAHDGIMSGHDEIKSGQQTRVPSAHLSGHSDGQLSGQSGLRESDRRDLCAAFQAAVADILAEKTRRALALYRDAAPLRPAFAVAGGVAANAAIRSRLQAVCAAESVEFVAPPLALCTDNAAMIAWAALERARAGLGPDAAISARPRWPLDPSAAPMIGAGKKGAKA